MSTTFNKVVETIWRSLLVAAGYTITLTIGGLVVNLAGLSLPEVKHVNTTLIWSFVSGFIVGVSLGPIASSIPTSKTRHIVVWGSVLFFNLVSVAIEGYFFAPDMIGDSLTGLILQQILTAFITGSILTVLFSPRETAASLAPSSRSVFSWSWRFAISTLSYVVFYFIFGALNYGLVTKPYYETHTGGLIVPPLNVVLVAELIRGVLIVLSLLPFLLTKRSGKKRLVLLSGLILFCIGGLVPLAMQVNALPLFLLVASAWEIFFMNFSTGAILALLLGQYE